MFDAVDDGWERECAECELGGVLEGSRDEEVNVAVVGLTRDLEGHGDVCEDCSKGSCSDRLDFCVNLEWYARTVEMFESMAAHIDGSLVRVEGAEKYLGFGEVEK